jgi:hypothetical protein
VSSITVNTQTVSAVVATFRIVTAEAVTGKPKVDVDAFGGTAGTFASGRPETNVSHIAGSAVSTSSAQLGVNVVNAAGTAWGSGAITAGAIASDAIAAAKIASGAITSAKFASGAITADSIAADAIGASELASDAANEIADALLDRTAGVETSLTVRQWLRLAASVLFGKASGMGTNTNVFRDFGDTKDRISATTDSSGNRTAVTSDST